MPRGTYICLMTSEVFLICGMVTKGGVQCGVVLIRLVTGFRWVLD